MSYNRQPSFNQKAPGLTGSNTTATGMYASVSNQGPNPLSNSYRRADEAINQVQRLATSPKNQSFTAMGQSKRLSNADKSVANLSALLLDESAFSKAMDSTLKKDKEDPLSARASTAQTNQFSQKTNVNEVQKPNAQEQISKIFLVKDREYHFSETDKIFFMEKPTEQRYQKSNCYTCDASFAQLGGPKAMIYCQFCAQANCKNCCVKTRYFKLSWSTNQDPSEEEKFKNGIRGRCCKVCDRKFIIRASFKQKFQLMDTQALQQKMLQSQYDRMFDEIQAYKDEYESSQSMFDRNSATLDPDIERTENELVEIENQRQEIAIKNRELEDEIVNKENQIELINKEIETLNSAYLDQQDQITHLRKEIHSEDLKDRQLKKQANQTNFRPPTSTPKQSPIQQAVDSSQKSSIHVDQPTNASGRKGFTYSPSNASAQKINLKDPAPGPKKGKHDFDEFDDQPISDNESEIGGKHILDVPDDVSSGSFGGKTSPRQQKDSRQVSQNTADTNQYLDTSQNMDSDEEDALEQAKKNKNKKKKIKGNIKTDPSSNQQMDSCCTSCQCAIF